MVVGVNLQEREGGEAPVVVERLSPVAKKTINLKLKLKNLEIKQAFIRNNSR